MSIRTSPYSRFQPISGSCGEIVVWGRKVSGKSCRIHGHMNHLMILPFIEWITRFDFGLTAPLRLLSCYLSVGFCFISMHGSGLYPGRLFGIHSGLRGGKTKRDRGITACVESSMEVSRKLRASDHNVENQSFRRVIGRTHRNFTSNIKAARSRFGLSAFSSGCYPPIPLYISCDYYWYTLCEQYDPFPLARSKLTPIIPSQHRSAMEVIHFGDERYEEHSNV
jgi:hypothetical protein